MVLISLVSLVLNSVALNAQKPLSDLSEAPVMMVLKKTPNLFYPIRFEESDSTIIKSKRGEITRIEYFNRYTDRRNTSKGGIRITKVSKSSISITQNDTLRVEIKRQGDKHSGIIGGKKGKIIREFIHSKNSSIPPSELYIMDSDSSYFIIYRPELGLVEIESNSQVQYRRMIGELFTDACDKPIKNAANKEINRSLNEGDELQILYSHKRLSDDGLNFKLIPNKLLTIKLKDFISGSETNRLNFTSKTFDVDHSTLFDEKSSFIEFYEGGIAIDEQVLIKDSLYPLSIKVSPPETEARSDPFYPFFEFAGPTVEVSYERSIELNDTLFDIFSYWNTTNLSRFNVLRIFPFPWRDNAENFIGNPVYLKLGKKAYGKLYEIDQNPRLHFAQVLVTLDSLILDVSSDKLQNITIELQQLDGTTIRQLKQSHGIRKGITRIPFEKLDLTYGSQADIVLITKVNNEAIEHQRFRYIQNN